MNTQVVSTKWPETRFKKQPMLPRVRAGCVRQHLKKFKRSSCVCVLGLELVSSLQSGTKTSNKSDLKNQYSFIPRGSQVHAQLKV